MISGHARFKSRERGSFTDLVNPEDGAAAIANEHSPFGIECDSSGDAEIPGELLGLLERSNPINSPIVATGNKHLAAWTECESARVYHLSEKRLTLAVRSDLKH